MSPCTIERAIQTLLAIEGLVIIALIVILLNLRRLAKIDRGSFMEYLKKIDKEGKKPRKS